jgi:hypothetical protein
LRQNILGVVIFLLASVSTAKAVNITYNIIDYPVRSPEIYPRCTMQWRFFRYVCGSV